MIEMAQKTDAQVTIGGKTYTLSGYESEEYLQEIAEYLNARIEEMRQDRDYNKISVEMRTILLNLNIADDYFKERARSEELSRMLDQRENDLSDMKHELVAAQMRLKAAEKKKSGK